MTFGKVMGGGFPCAAFGGRADLMGQLAPDGPVYQAGTLSGNPVAAAAGLATLRLATPEVYRQLDSTAARLRSILGRALGAAGVHHVIQNAGNLFSVFFFDDPVSAVRDLPGAQAQAGHRYRAFFQAMLAAGVYLPPSPYEAWFVSSAHGAAELERVEAALPGAAVAAAAA